MIYLTKATANIITCEANKLNTSGFYLWRFVSDQYKTEYLIYLEPLSVSNRFCTFGLTLPGDVDLVNKGFYHYYVYDGDGVSTDYAAMSELENGKINLSE